MRQLLLAVLIAFTALAPSAHAGTSASDRQTFEKLFSAWTSAFNQKKLTPSCAFFSKNLHAQYQGVPPKSYTTLCRGIKEAFAEKTLYQYKYKIRQVYHSGNLAAVRVTWYLQISEHGKVVSQSQDEGLDVLQQNAKGQWEIVNYVAYPVAKGQQQVAHKEVKTAKELRPAARHTVMV